MEDKILSLIENNRISVARYLIQKAINEEGENESTLSLSALCCYAEFKWDEALDLCDQAVGYDPDHFPAYFTKSLIRLSVREWEKAYPLITKMIEIAPENPLTWEQAAKYYLQAGEFEKAVDACRNAINIEPKAEDPYYLMAIALYKQGDHATAEACLMVNLDLDPEAAKAYLLSGMMALSDVQTQEAKGQFEQALKLEGTNRVYRQAYKASLYSNMMITPLYIRMGKFFKRFEKVVLPIFSVIFLVLYFYFLYKLVDNGYAQSEHIIKNVLLFFVLLLGPRKILNQFGFLYMTLFTKEAYYLHPAERWGSVSSVLLFSVGIILFLIPPIRENWDQSYLGWLFLFAATLPYNLQLGFVIRKPMATILVLYVVALGLGILAADTTRLSDSLVFDYLFLLAMLLTLVIRTNRHDM